MRIWQMMVKAVIALSILPGAASIAAHEMIVTRHFSGLWDQPEQESQGISLQIVHQDDGPPSAVAYWFTYGADMQTAWFLGVGNLVNDRIEMELFRASGVGFMQPDAPGDAQVVKIGTMMMTFQHCDQGTVDFSSTDEEVGSGSFPIARLTWIHNTNCSGGVSDDFHAGAMHREQRVELTPARGGINGSGHADLEMSAGHMEFEVEVEDMPDGSYNLFVGPHNRGEIPVTGGMGRLEFRSPGESGRQLLNFDPRDMTIEVHDGQGAALTSGGATFSDDDYDHQHNFDCSVGSGRGGGMGGGGMGGGHHGEDCVDESEFVEIEVDMLNTGVIARADGEAEWEMHHRHVEFKVEIKDVPAGPYPLVVGGEEVGTIQAIDDDGEVRGELEFRDPQRVGTEHLDFDPRGQLIEVLQVGDTVLQADFPEG
jgi:hypothetical protein